MSAHIHRILFLNPPHKLSVARRYMCSYHSPMYLLPCHDLIQLATCIREWNKVDVSILDAIALKKGEDDVIRTIGKVAPDMVVAIVGVETFGEDLACLDRLKAACPSVLFAVFGYYPTFFAEETLNQSAMDMILRCEPEMPLTRYLEAGAEGMPLENIPGLAARRPSGETFANPEERLGNLDSIPFADYSLVDISLYEEAFLGRPCGAILSARGCPFSCTYCTTTYGRRMVMKSPENVVAEMRHLKVSGIRVIRFLDDTFTFNRDRVIRICKQLIQENLGIPWSCLARIDTLDAEMLDWMARAGCARILVGIESYSQKVLDFLQKRLNADDINPRLKLIREAGISPVGFIMVGVPIETEADFQETVNGLLASTLDYIAVNIVTPYAGTLFYDQTREYYDFALFPYHLSYRDPGMPVIFQKRMRKLYLRFYLRPTVLLRRMRELLHPLRVFRMLWLLLR